MGVSPYTNSKSVVKAVGLGERSSLGEDNLKSVYSLVSYEKEEELRDETIETIESGIETTVDTGQELYDAGTNAIGEGIDSFWESYYDVHSKIKTFVPLLFVGSIMIGVLVVVFARKNKFLRQRGIVIFCIVIPVTLLLLVYGMAYVRPISKYAVDGVQHETAQIEVVQDTTSSENAINIYNDVLNRTQNAEAVVQKEKEAYQIWNGYEHLQRMLKNHIVVLILACEVFGIIIMVLSRRDKSLKRWAGTSLCIALPLVILALVYLIPEIKKIFL